MNRTLCAVALLLPAVNSFAQTSYPEKPVRIVVPFASGTAIDFAARVVGQKFSEAWNKPVIIENVAGAAGIVGAERVAKAAPDGYTMLYSGDAAMTTNVTLYSKLP